MKHLTAHEQAVRGLEYLSLVQYYLHGDSADQPRKKRRRRRKNESAPVDQSFARVHDGRMTATLVAELIYLLHGVHSLRQKPSSRERLMRVYIRAAQKEFSVGSNYAQRFHEIGFQRALCSHYLWNYKVEDQPAFMHNDSAIESYVMSVGLRQPEKLEPDCSLALHELIVIRSAIRLGLRLELKIREGRNAGFLRCYPVALETMGQRMSLVVFEMEKNRYRRLNLADLEIVNPDLWRMIQQNVPSSVSMSAADAERQLRKDETRATISMPRDYYPHFLRNLNAPVDVVGEQPHVIRVQIRGFSTADLEQAVYPHLGYVDIEPRALKEQIYGNVARKIRPSSRS